MDTKLFSKMPWVTDPNCCLETGLMDACMVGEPPNRHAELGPELYHRTRPVGFL